MPRPKNREASIKVTITATPKFGEYLDDLVAEEDYGSNRAEVARSGLKNPVCVAAAAVGAPSWRDWCSIAAGPLPRVFLRPLLETSFGARSKT